MGDSEEKRNKDKNAEKEEQVSSKTTLKGDPVGVQKELDKSLKEELQIFKKNLAKNEDPEQETKVSDSRLESVDDRGEGEDQANGNHCESKDGDPCKGQGPNGGQKSPTEGQQGPFEGQQDQTEDEDPRRARLSGLSLTLGRGAVPRALRF